MSIQLSQSSNSSSNNPSEKIENNSQQIISIQLGDVIQFEDSTNDILNNNKFIIDYIDANLMKLINVDDFNAIQLNINENGEIAGGTITNMNLLYRNEKLGYARQNGLLPHVWVNVYFGGETPAVITGEITNLEEDMIEITVYPDSDVLYINFGYRGIPIDLPIDTIEIRQPPEKRQKETRPEETGLEVGPQIQEDDFLDDRSFGSDLPLDTMAMQDTMAPGAEVRNQRREFIIKADEIHFGREYAAITQVVNVGESEQRYSLDVQTNDLLEELLSKTPYTQRTTTALNNIHIMIERFTQLRKEFSQLDDYGNVTAAFVKGADWKPLANSLIKMKTLLYWIIPIVKNVKIIYDNVPQDDSIISDISFFSSKATILSLIEKMQNYTSSVGPIDQNRYVALINELNEYFKPFDYVNPELTSDVINSFRVKNELNVVVDNLGDMYSSTVDSDAIKSRRFVMQKYNTALTRLDATQLTGSKMVAHRVLVGESDLLEIRSILSLPEPAIRFSAVNLPGTNILDKANLSSTFLTYWQLLKEKTRVEDINVDNFEKDIDFDANNYANNIKCYNLSLTEESSLKKSSIYKKFLQKIVPKTRVLFNLMQKYITGKLSVIDVVGYLEPFMIYSDDITFMQFKEISQFLNTRIDEYNKRFVARSKIFGLLKKSTINSSKERFTTLSDLINTTKNKNEIFQDFYGVDLNAEFTNSEIMTLMTQKDCGNIYYTGLSLENLNLMLTIDINRLIDAQKEALDTGIENAKALNKCNTYVIAKQYFNEEEVTSDNGKPIYFDRKYDNTLYSIIEEYEKEQLKMSPEAFHSFLVGKLKTKYKYNDSDSEYLADTLINGVKKIVDGNIAIMFVPTEDKINYYRRSNNRWELDDTIDENSLNMNNDSLLCNIQNNCVEVYQKSGPQCESLDLNKKELQQQLLKNTLEEFDKNYQASKAELEQRINITFDYYLSIMDKIKSIEKSSTYKYNNFQYELGLESENVTVDSTEEIKVSPFLKLRDMILGHSDFIKKQNDIVRFVARFTREPHIDSIEDEHWRYCIQTNTKLLPNFIYTLAAQFIEDPDRYTQKMDSIIKTNGTLSDDGEAWVDKYSGYVIRNIDYDVEEGYDDGFRIRSREIMEQDAGDTYLSEQNKEKKYQSVEAQMASNVISAMANNMGINIDEQREFILKIITTTLPIAIPSKDAYQQRVQELAKRGKTIPEYKKIYNATMLYITLGAFLIGIQTSIPSIKTRKTFPGCVRSFVGYPFDGAGDYSALTYIACIAYKIRKAGDDPWSGFSGIKESVIPTEIKKAIDNYYISNVDVVQKFREKTEYLLTNPNEDIPREHDLSKWVQFLPPLVPFHMKHVENISRQFKESFLNDLRSGSREQEEKSLIIESKIIFFSLAIQEKIQRIVAGKQLLLSNSAHEPFLENACCSSESKNETTVIEYFEKQDPSIKEFNDIVQQLSNIMYDVINIAEAPYLFSRENTKNIYPPLSDEFSEETIYRAFITLCRFNSSLALNEDLLAVCTSKPNYINIADSISEKIRKLKQDGRLYNNDSMLRLLEVIARQNIIPMSLDTKVVTPIEKLRISIDEIIEQNDDVIPSSLLLNILSILDTYDIASTDDSQEMRQFKNYLARANGVMKKSVLDFFTRYGNLSRNENEKMKNILESLMTWENVDINTARGIENNISDDLMYNSIDFIQTYIQNFLKTFPNIIINSVNYDRIKIPNYMGLSRSHVDDIQSFVHKYYTSLSPFYKDPTLSNIFVAIQERSHDILKLANNTPSFTDIQYKTNVTNSIFDRKISMLLYENYLMQSFVEYINLANDENMLNRTMPNETETFDLFTTDYVDELQQRVAFTGIELERNRGIQTGSMKDLKEKTAELLITYLKIMGEHKSIIDLSYDNIMDLVFKTKEREKDTFTDRLKSKTDEERNVDTILKINKLGVWSKGLSKGLTSYDKDNYDEEREYMEELAEVENKAMKNKNFSDRNASQFIEDYLEDQEAANFIDREENDMTFLTEDYMDGDFGGENEENYNEYD